MSAEVIDRLREAFGDRILGASSFRGDDEVVVSADDWVEVVTFLRDDERTAMNHFGDLTAVDYPEREGPRFDVLLFLRSIEHRTRIRVRTRVAEGQPLATLTGVFRGTDWAERECFDMFGVRFEGHPDLRRILLYDEFEGHPLRKDYPIERAQPIVEYRHVEGVEKLPPFGIEEGQPFARVDWESRLAGRDDPVSPSIAVQQGQRRALSDSEIAEAEKAELDKRGES